MNIESNRYAIRTEKEIATPALVYYEDIIRQNTKRAIEIAGCTGRLWPHVKSHKVAEVVRIQIELGITRFKCATIAEGEMVAACGAEHVLLAYPLVGPAILRFIQLGEAYPATRFWAIGDDPGQLGELGRAAGRRGREITVLLDVNMGMNRTGVPLWKLAQRYRDCACLEGIRLEGMHCYDGHRTELSAEERATGVRLEVEAILQVKKALEEDGVACSVMVMGGSPSFPMHAAGESAFLSPGTVFIFDYGYAKKYPDLGFEPGAALLARVISHPEQGIFSLDLGTKAIATDPEERGLVLGLQHAKPLFQSEEHWTFVMEPGYEEQRPPIGTVFYVIPYHICPTSALYSHVLVARNGEIAGEWAVAARNRKIVV